MALSIRGQCCVIRMRSIPVLLDSVRCLNFFSIFKADWIWTTIKMKIILFVKVYNIAELGAGSVLWCGSGSNFVCSSNGDVKTLYCIVSDYLGILTTIFPRIYIISLPEWIFTVLYLPPGKIVSKVPVQPVIWNTFGISIGVTMASGNGACCRTLSTQILQRPVTSRL
jgi:hypothetical protein